MPAYPLPPSTACYFLLESLLVFFPITVSLPVLQELADLSFITMGTEVQKDEGLPGSQRH